MKDHMSALKSSRNVSPLVWAAFLLLCTIAGGAAIRRILVLIAPPTLVRAQNLQALDDVFAARKGLTLFHIVPALAFIVLLPAWFLPSVRKRVVTHRRLTYALLALGFIVGLTAIALSLHPVGGVNEAAAAILYDSLFLFSLARATFLLQQGNMGLHRTWMLRSVAVLLGIATTRPIMGLFFATASRTHLGPEQFFGTAFWLGFTLTYIGGEAYIRSHPSEGSP
jgi:Predicted membrane protein (DUF2306)